jgi:integrase/recombinase XerC
VLITAYCNWLTLSGYRPATITARRSCLESFERSVAPHQLADATRLHVEAFLSRPLAPESRRAYRAHLRGLYGWAAEQGYVTSDPTEKVPSIRVPKALPRPLARGDLSTALEAATPRMRAWLLLMSLCGLRCIEVAHLRPDDLLDTPQGVVFFLREQKGGGQGSVPAHPAAMEALAVLPIRSGLWWDCKPRHVSITVSAYLKGLGIRGTAHRLRHTAGGEFYRASGHDLLATMQLMRHAGVQSTQGYVELDPTRAAEVIRLVRPPEQPQPMLPLPDVG